MMEPSEILISTKVVYMSSKILRLAVGSHNLSQAKKKAVLFLQAKQIHKIHSKWSWVKKVVILSKNTYFVSCTAACQLSRQYFVIQFEINQVIQQP